ncbi:MAG: hypothetical protein KatS3mg015_2010 [Fimbriimonadales bacterium]|nr:MAG: hypothetical protein KatS3mg015_2010 [Fimbriimonadales bacterium]
MRRRGLTLIELLVVLAIVAILAALLFPVFVKAKRASQQSVCIQNLKQIGGAFALYMQDYDDIWPLGIDPADKFTPEIWDHEPQFRAKIPYLPLMHELLEPYLPTMAVWKCPADHGQDIDDVAFVRLPASPSSYATYGTSYYYRTELTVRSLQGTSLRDPASINVYFDGSGAWHTSEDILRHTDDLDTILKKLRKYRYNVLFADLHVKNLNRDQYQAAWDAEL